jgi:hypothetical protein
MGATCCPGLCYDPSYGQFGGQYGGQYGGQWNPNFTGGYGQPCAGGVCAPGAGIYGGGVGVMPGMTTSVIGPGVIAPGMVRY